MKYLEDLSKETGLRVIVPTANEYNDIISLYKSDIFFAKISHSYPVLNQNVIDDITTIPPITDKEHKYYLAFYQGNSLVAVLDFIDGYNYKGIDKADSIWIGLLQVNQYKKEKGIGTMIIKSFVNILKNQKKKFIQIGVIKENIPAIKFWSKNGFVVASETKVDNLNLLIMEYRLY